MRAMILAAGKGTRLRPLTDSVPKPLIEVAGRPMIAYALDLVRGAGITEVVVNLHHLGEQIRAALGDGSGYGVHIHYSEEDPLLDTGGGIAAARRWLADDTFVVANADTFIDLDLRQVIDFHRAQRGLVTMVLRPDPDALRNDDIRVDATQRIRRFLGSDAPGLARADTERLPRLMYPGVMVLEPRLFESLPDGAYSITRDVFPRLLATGEPLVGFVHDGYWRVLDTPQDLAAGRREIAARMARCGDSS